jgi:hypothetical protein
MKKWMLRLCTTGTGEEYFELNKDEPGTMLSSKNHTGGLEGTEAPLGREGLCSHKIAKMSSKYHQSVSKSPKSRH